MTRQQFAASRATTILGVSVVVGMPLGQYDPNRSINIGTNRWSIKPEVGFSRRRGRWTFEGDLGALFFTDNTNFLNGGTRQQSPIAAAQGHLTYTFRPGLWLAGDGNVWTGGRVTVNGAANLEKQRNSRLGITVAVPVGRQQVRVAYSFGAFRRSAATSNRSGCRIPTPGPAAPDSPRSANEYLNVTLGADQLVDVRLHPVPAIEDRANGVLVHPHAHGAGQCLVGQPLHALP